ncbi:hypothetical protein TNCV_2136641 [Trichonephila clavipes]|nr:hypothetical protein TNCV_2136641 [Trichonephila clavipes]
MTVSRIWNRWVQDGNSERYAGSAQTKRQTCYLHCLNRTCSHVTSPKSRILGHLQDNKYLHKQFGDAVAWILSSEPWQRLSLTLHQRQESLQWCDK